jgi:hypothetical protein
VRSKAWLWTNTRPVFRRGWCDLDQVDAVRHDASSLYKFIDSVVLPCAVKTHFSYTSPSREFFEFISGLGNATKNHVADLSRELDAALFAANSNDFNLRAQELATLRYSWFELHEFIKPAADAHTLQSPVPLVAVMTARLRNLPGFEKVRFAIVHTSDVNYFQLHSNYVRQLATQISMIVSAAPGFPEDLAIVGLPYSQAKAVFLNALLAHEMGHFSFQKRDERKRLSSPLTAVFAKQSVSAFSKQDVARCLGIALGWLEEIYCDLFALRLAGPSFSYAFIELFALTRRKPSAEFSGSHPAMALRLREQTRLLQASSEPWWPMMLQSPNHYTDLLARTMDLKDSDCSCKNAVVGGVEQVALSCFFEMLGEVAKAINDIFGESDQEVALFSTQRDVIGAYLSFGVVPSRLIIGTEAVNPSGITLLNATYGFYLNHLDSLLIRLSAVDRNCVQCRAYWAERVEMWAGKALEDVITNGYTLKVTY